MGVGSLGMNCLRVVRRRVYKRINAAFEEHGIEFARRKVEVHAAGAAHGGGRADLSGAGAATASEQSAAE